LTKKNNLTYAIIAKACKASESTAKRCIHSIPAKRDHIICLAILFGFDINTTDWLLTEFGKCERLYSKNINDAIWMFVINKNHVSNRPNREKTPMQDFIDFKKTAASVFDDIDNWKEIDKNTAPVLDTLVMKQDFSYIHNETEFMIALHGAIPGFITQNVKLHDYILQLIKKRKQTANKLFEDNPNFKTYHYRQISRLEEGRAPDRHYLIKLGLKLNMTGDEINALLDRAGMAPLCGNDVTETAIFYILEDLNCNYPNIFFYNRTDAEGVFAEQSLEEVKESLKKYLQDDNCYQYATERYGILRRFFRLVIKRIKQKEYFQ